MPIDFYYILGSPPCRSVMLLAKALEVKLNLIHTDLSKGEHQTPAFLKLNPQHAIPTINDNGLAIGESRAILCYLVNQYGKDDSLYPKDPKKRAIVDQRLYFDMGSLYQGFVNYYLVPIMNTGKHGDPLHLEKLKDSFNVLDKILAGQTWTAGNSITIADYSIVLSVASVEYTVVYTVKFGETAKLERLHGIYKTLDTFLDGKEWVTGNDFSVADFTIAVSAASAESSGFDASKSQMY